MGYGAQANGGRTVSIGQNAGVGASTQNIHTLSMGTSAGTNVVGNNTVMIGRNAGTQIQNSAVNISETIAIGSNAGLNMQSSALFNNNSQENILVGKNAGQNLLSPGANVYIGSNAGLNSKTAITALIPGTGYVDSNGEIVTPGAPFVAGNNVGVGALAGAESTGELNASVGWKAGWKANGSGNVNSGLLAGYSVTGDNNVSIGTHAGWGVTADRSISLGNASRGYGTDSIAIGSGARASGKSSISIGTGNQVTGERSGAIGDPSYVGGTGSYSLGNNNFIGDASNNAFAMGNNVIIGENGTDVSGAVAIGNNTKVNIAGGVALGEGAVASTASGVVGYDPVLETTSTNVASPVWNSARAAVSVGNGAADTRQITGLAAGAVDTDAVNVAQLKALSEVTVKYDSPEKNAITLGGGNTGRDPVRITNLAAGQVSSYSTHAVNGSQLYNSAQSIANNFGGGSKVLSDGTITAPTYHVMGGSYSSVGDAFGAISGGFDKLDSDIKETGAFSAALSGLKPIQYDPREPSQIMAAIGTYRDEWAAAVGLAHYTKEDTLLHAGLALNGSGRAMLNAGLTFKFGGSDEKKKLPDRYKDGPISSIYVMQEENESLQNKVQEQEEQIAQLREENNMIKARLADIMIKLDM